MTAAFTWQQCQSRNPGRWELSQELSWAEVVRGVTSDQERKQGSSIHTITVLQYHCSDGCTAPRCAKTHWFYTERTICYVIYLNKATGDFDFKKTLNIITAWVPELELVALLLQGWVKLYRWGLRLRPAQVASFAAGLEKASAFTWPLEGCWSAHWEDIFLHTKLSWRELQPCLLWTFRSHMILTHPTGDTS